jgi:LacI family transcriptional regulator
VRIADIAREAGVGTATVDRVLNGRSGVGASTAQRVVDVARRLKYTGVGLESEAARPATLSFDFLLPSGPHSFFRLVEEAIGSVREHQPGFTASAVRHEIERFNPGALAEALLRIGPHSKGVALVALEHPQVREAVNAVSASGVPVVTMISDLSNSSRLGYVGIDNRAAGRTAGHLLGRFMGSGPGEVAMIAGSLSYRGHEEREMGFRAILREEFQSLDVVGLREGHDDDRESYLATGDLLREHPGLRGVYNIGAAASGIAAAIEEAGRAGDITFVCHELNAETRRFLVGGVVDAIIHQDPRHEVAMSLRMLANFQRGADPLLDVRPLHIEIYIRENLP